MNDQLKKNIKSIRPIRFYEISINIADYLKYSTIDVIFQVCQLKQAMTKDEFLGILKYWD